MRELRRELEAQIADAERRLEFWEQQERLQAGTELVEHVRRIVVSFKNQLAALYSARRQFDA